MKNLLTLSVMTAALTFAACSKADAPAVIADAPAVNEMASAAMDKVMVTKTKAVLIYADWCGSCKVLDPKIEQVQAMGAMPGLEFVTLDYTAKDDADFYAQAKAAGVEDAVRDQLEGTVKTGQLLLVDLNDKKVVGRVTKELDTAQIAKALKDAIAAS